MRTSFEEKAMILSLGLDGGIASRDQLKDIAKLQADIYKFMWLYPEIVSISMSTPSLEGLRTIASNNTEEIGIFSDEEGISVYNEGKFLTKTLLLPNGNRVFSMITPIHVGGQIAGIYDIKISLKMEEEIISQQQRYVAIAILVSVVILVVMLYFLLSMMVITPIDKIKNGLAIIAKGNLRQRFTSRSNDEIGDLTKKLNEMVEKLEEFYKDLDGKVREKTKELEEAKMILEIKVKARTKELEEMVKNQEEVIQERTKETQNKLVELERFNKLTVGRELKMIELKKEIEKLENEIERLKGR